MSLIPLSYILFSSVIVFGSLAEHIPIPTFQTLWRAYQNSMNQGLDSDINIFNTLHLLRCITCLFLLYNLNKIAIYSNISILWVKIYTISLVSLVVFSDVPVIAFRVSELLQVVEIVLIPTLVLIPSYRSIGKYMAIVFGASLLFINTFYNNFF